MCLVPSDCVITVHNVKLRMIFTWYLSVMLTILCVFGSLPSLLAVAVWMMCVGRVIGRRAAVDYSAVMCAVIMAQKPRQVAAFVQCSVWRSRSNI